MLVKFEGLDEDLPEVSLERIEDTYAQFELQLPFSRTLITRFMTKLDNARKACGDQGYVTIEALKAELNTPAWDDLNMPESELHKFLCTEIFLDSSKGHVIGQLDYDLMRIFGILHCRGTIKQKAQYFYEILQAGGVEKQASIAASDKDFKPNFEKICALSVWDLFDANTEIEIGSSTQLYSQEEIEKLKQEVEILLEYHFIEHIYGANSKVDY